jgi:exportin-T
MVLRLLHEVSITLGSDATLRAFRSRERIARDTAVRDEIRQSHSVDIASSVWKVIEDGLQRVEQMRAQGGLSNGQSLNGQTWTLAKSIEVTCEATTVIGDYASWIDISLIVTPLTVTLLYRLLQQSEPSLRTAAADALLEIASKGMKGEDKIELLRVLNLTSTISELEKGTRPSKVKGDLSDDEVTFREHLAKLANGVGIDLARVIESTKSTPAARATADKMLLTHLSLILDFLTDEWDELAEAVLPCIADTLSIYKRLKRTEKSIASGTEVSPDQLSVVYTQEKADFLSRLMGILLVKMKFDDDTDWNGGGSKSGESDDEDSDEEEIGKFLKLRKVMQQNAAAIANIDEAIFSGPTQQLILETLHACDAYLSQTGPPVSWQQVEVALYTLYFCIDVSSASQGLTKVGVNASSFVHLPPDATKTMRNKPAEGYFYSLTLNPLGELVQRFFQSNVSAFRHAAVQLQYFECSVRYSTFFQTRPDLVGDALAPYLDWRGIHNERPSVRHRVYYLFLRFIRETKEQMQPNFVRGILENMQDLLVVTAKLPAVEPNEDPLEVAMNKSSGFDHQLNLFEACGVLLRMLKTSPNDQVMLLRALTEPLSKQLATAVQQHQANKGDLQTILQVHHLFFALSNVAKGFPDLNGSGVAKLVDTMPWMSVFKEVTEQLLSALSSGSLRDYRVIRDAARGAFSRMVATTGLVVLPYIPSLLNALLSQVSADELMDFYSFLGLVVNKYKMEVESVVDELLTPLLERTFYFLNQEVTGTDDQVQRQHLVRGYVSFLSGLLGVGLDGVLRSSRNQPQLETVLQSLVFYAANTEASSMRPIFNILTKLVLMWGGRVNEAAGANGVATKHSSEKPLPGFENFIYKTLVGLIFEVPGKPDFDFSDAQTQIVSWTLS